MNYKRKLKTKGFYQRLFEEDGIAVTYNVNISYEEKRNILYVSSWIMSKGERVGFSVFDYVNTKELRKRVKELLMETPTLSSYEVARHINCTMYWISRVYMSVKREVYKEMKEREMML